MPREIWIFILIILSIAASVIGLAYMPVTAVETGKSLRCTKILNQLRNVYTLYRLDIGCQLDTFPPIETLYRERLVYEQEYALCSRRPRSTTDYYNIYGYQLERVVHFPKANKPDFCYFYNDNLPKNPNSIIVYCPKHVSISSNNNDDYVPVLFRNGETKNLRWHQFKRVFEKQGKLLEKLGVIYTFESGIIGQKR